MHWFQYFIVVFLLTILTYSATLDLQLERQKAPWVVLSRQRIPSDNFDSNQTTTLTGV